jgi:hypothetical protein
MRAIAEQTAPRNELVDKNQHPSSIAHRPRALNLQPPTGPLRTAGHLEDAGRLLVDFKGARIHAHVNVILPGRRFGRYSPRVPAGEASAILE